MMPGKHTILVTGAAASSAASWRRAWPRSATARAAATISTITTIPRLKSGTGTGPANAARRPVPLRRTGRSDAGGGAVPAPPADAGGAPCRPGRGAPFAEPAGRLCAVEPGGVWPRAQSAGGMESNTCCMRPAPACTAPTPRCRSPKTTRPTNRCLYAATKKANELMAHTYSHLYRLPATGVRFFTVHGPRGRPYMAYFRFTEKLLRGEPIPVFASSQLWRDFTYIEDIVESVVRLLFKPHPAEARRRTGYLTLASSGAGQIGPFHPHAPARLGLRTAVRLPAHAARRCRRDPRRHQRAAGLGRFCPGHAAGDRVGAFSAMV